jgi:hypothetical protein
LKCVICNELIPLESNGWDGGNNAEPVKSGRCCTACNWAVVIPARIKRMQEIEGVKKGKKHD